MSNGQINNHLRELIEEARTTADELVDQAGVEAAGFGQVGPGDPRKRLAESLHLQHDPGPVDIVQVLH